MSKEKPSRIREVLARRNYFINVPDGLSTQNVFLDYLKSKNRKVADFQLLTSAATHVALETREKWKPLNPNIQLLEKGDTDEERRVSIEVSKMRLLIRKALEEQTTFITDPQHGSISHKGEDMQTSDESKTHTTLKKFLGKHQVVQNELLAWAKKRAQMEGGVIVVGNNPQKVEADLFETLTPGIPADIDYTDKDAVQELIGKKAFYFLREAAKEVKRKLKIQDEQEKIQVRRDEFKWSSNPLITEVRSLANGVISEYCRTYARYGVTEFDLATQVMMHLPTYDANKLWSGDANVIKNIKHLIEGANGDQATTITNNAVQSGEIALNMNLVRSEVERQAIKLAQHYSTLSVQSNDKTLILPAKYMGDPSLNPFQDTVRTEIDAQKRQFVIDDETGDKIMEVTEKHSGKKIVFRRISPEMSKLYSLGFSNLHYARDGELVSFGAFLEGDEFPFAYSSYAQVTRNYTKEMLKHFDIDPENVIESTRAWNASWAPENTMSTLFSYSHTMLQEARADEIKNDSSKRALSGIVTSINPNLGFKAVSFRGVRFNIAAIKPTSFSYLINPDGTADFMPKNSIKQLLGITSDEELENDHRYQTNQIPFLPTLELLSLFDMKKEKELLERHIYKITAEAMQKG